MGFLLDAEATRSTLLSVDTTLSENINATQNYIPVASTTNFSTSVVAEIETTNEVVSFTDISENNFQQSQTFDNGYWQKLRSTVTADATTAPDGTTTAEQLTQASGQTSNGLIQVSGAGLSVTNTKTYTISIFAKKGTNRNYLMIKETMGRGTGSSQWFNLNTGAVASVSPSVGSGLTSTISSVGDGWFRCSIKFTADATRTGQCGFIVSENDGNTSNTDDQGFIYIWGAQFEEASTASTYLPTTSSVLVGLTDVTRGVNGTTAASASSGDSIQQLPYALLNVDMPVRLKGLSISPDGTGAGRLTLCDNNGDTLCDIDIPDGKIYTLFLPEEGIVFPNGVFVSNTINVTGYTVFTSKYSGPNLT